MKREFKFRAWNCYGMSYNIITGRFGSFWVNEGVNLDGLDVNDKSCLTPFNTKCVDSTIIMQSSGILDKKEKEIYEGDLFHLGDINIKYVVEWQDCGLKGRQVTNKATVGLEYWKDAIEIMGNIYENPELLS